MSGHAPLRAVIFDFDGVILDSNALKTAVFRQVFARFPGHETAMMRYHDDHVSESRFVKFAHLAERLGRAGDRAFIDALAADFAERLRAGMDACPMVPGAGELLGELHARVPLFLASVTPEAELLRLLDVHRLHHFFRAAYGCPPWTKPAAVADIIEGLGGPDGVVLIGDSAGDQRAAALNGVEFIARDSGLAFDPPVTGAAHLETIAAALRLRSAA